MRRVVASAAIALGIALGLGGALVWFKPWAPRVALLTGNPLGGTGCYTDSAEGPLVIDANYGMAIIDNDLQATVPATIMWRPGYTARRAGSEVEVLDPLGNVVATTGRSYRIEGGYVGGGWVRTFFACGFVIPQ